MATSVTLKPNAIDISGSTSGTTTLQATAVAGTTTITLPAATDTLVGKATTDTLTNKTLTSPTITGGALNGTLGATTPSTVAATSITASTTLGVTGVATLTADATISGLTVGRGAGAVATNTAVGAQALNTTATGGGNTGVGYQADASITSGTSNSAFGQFALTSNSTGSFNTGIGTQALNSNTTASNNTAVGYQAGYSNTTASNNTAVGYQAGYSNTTGIESVYIGQGSGYSATTNGQNTFVGRHSGYSTTGGFNNFFGYGAGNAITTGTKNTILGRYDGNYGGLDIRTASNYIVLSDGDGNPRGIFDNSGNLLVGTTSASNRKAYFKGGVANNQCFTFDCDTGQNNYVTQFAISGQTPNNNTSRFLTCNDSTTDRAYIYSNGGIGNYSANNVNLSDRREKTNFSPAKSYLDVICAIPVQTFNYIDQNMEDDGGLTLGVVAQDVQAVAPELVMESNWGTEEEPKVRLSIYQTDLQYALMKCIQELKAEVDSLKAQINGASA